MKILFNLLTLIFSVSFWIALFYFIVKCIIDITKEKPFNWFNVLLIIICFAAYHFFKYKVFEINYKNYLQNKPKSGFQIKLEEMQKQKDSQNKNK